ncbi:MAG: hypothetical protein C5B53_03815 [Candidatus Melainabacteria bacterium]|nr:MAG: hypothetical protein C5B53_03815 [Candidatus Melainabacteria bacterium]
MASDTPVHGFSSYTATSGASLATKEPIQRFEAVQRRAILPGKPVLKELSEINEYSDQNITVALYQTDLPLFGQLKAEAQRVLSMSRGPLSDRS